jgi:hypothetical protein
MEFFNTIAPKRKFGVNDLVPATAPSHDSVAEWNSPTVTSAAPRRPIMSTYHEASSGDLGPPISEFEILRQRSARRGYPNI